MTYLLVEIDASAKQSCKEICNNTALSTDETFHTFEVEVLVEQSSRDPDNDIVPSAEVTSLLVETCVSRAII